MNGPPRHQRVIVSFSLRILRAAMVRSGDAPFERFAEQKAAADRTAPGDTSWWFTVSDQPAPRFAGIWKVDQDHDRIYAFCTTEPNHLIAPTHPKAMPVILMAEDHDRWLNAPIDEAVSLVSAYPSQLMAVT